MKIEQHQRQRHSQWRLENAFVWNIAYCWFTRVYVYSANFYEPIALHIDILNILSALINSNRFFFCWPASIWFSWHMHFCCDYTTKAIINAPKLALTRYTWSHFSFKFCSFCFLLWCAVCFFEMYFWFVCMICTNFSNCMQKIRVQFDALTRHIDFMDLQRDFIWIVSFEWPRAILCWCHSVGGGWGYCYCSYLFVFSQKLS